MGAFGVVAPQRVPTSHLYQGDLTNLTLGAVGVPTASAMRWFGQVNVYQQLVIAAVHAHWTAAPAGGGPVVIELWRARGILTGGPIVWTQLGTVTSTPTGAPQTFVYDSMVLTETSVLLGDYLFAQATAKNNSYEGLTFDVHFALS